MSDNGKLKLVTQEVELEKASFSAGSTSGTNPKGSFAIAEQYDSHRERAKVLRDLYENSPVASTCVDLIANSASKRYKLVPRNSLSTSADLTDPNLAPIIEFWSKPSADENFQSLINKIVVDLMVFGTCILSFTTTDSIPATNISKAIEKAFQSYNALTPNVSSDLAEAIAANANINGIPVALAILPYESMHILTDKLGAIIGYEQYLLDGGKITFAPNEVIQIWHPKSRSVTGNSPLQPLITLLTVSNLIDRRQKVSLQNDIVMDKIIQVSDAANTEEVRAFYTEIVSKYKLGGSNANLLVTTADMEVIDISRSKDGDFLGLNDKIFQKCLLKLGIPYSVAGMTDGTSSSYSAGSDIAYRLYVNNTLMPIANHVQDALNNKVMVHYQNIGLDYLIQLQLLDDDDTQANETMYNMQIRNGSMSINEIRAKRGQLPVEGGDETWVDAKSPITVANLAKQPAPVAPPKDIADPQINPNAPMSGKPNPQEVNKAIAEARSALRLLRKAL